MKKLMCLSQKEGLLFYWCLLYVLIVSFIVYLVYPGIVSYYLLYLRIDFDYLLVINFVTEGYYLLHWVYLLCNASLDDISF